MKRFIFPLLFLFTSLIYSQNNYSEFWDLLFNNQRKEALSFLSKINDKSTVEYLVAKEIASNEDGDFNYHKDFVPKFIKAKDYQNYLYAYWNHFFLFNDYLGEGFNYSNMLNIKQVYKSNITNESIKDALEYVYAVEQREEANWDGFIDNIKKIHSIDNWQYCGVFENLNKSGLDIDYLPETTPKSEKPFNAASNGFVNWYTPSKRYEIYQTFMNHSEYGSGVNYAQSFIKAEKDEEVILRIGSGSAFKLWLNDVLVYENTEDVSTDLNGYKVRLTIPKGNNRLLYKSASNEGRTFFIITPLNLDGTPNKTLVSSSEFNDYNKGDAQLINPVKMENEIEAFFIAKLDKNQNDYFSIVSLFNTYIRNSKADQAKALILPLLEKYPKSSYLKLMLVEVYNITGDTEEVEKITTNIEFDDPDYYLPIILKVTEGSEMQKMTLSKFKEFLDKLESTVDSEVISETAKFMYNARKEDIIKVKKNLDNIVKLAEDDVVLSLKCIPMYSSIFEEDSKTLKLLEKLASKRFNYSLNNRIARIYANKNDKKQVLKYITIGEDYFQDDNYFLKDIINTLHAYQDYKESLPYIEQGLKNFPYSFVLQELKADVLIQLKKEKEAIAYYEKVLSHNSADRNVRRKLKDLKNEENIIETLINDKIYDQVEERRNIIKENNYGFNFLYDDMVLELYSEGGGNYRYVNAYEITSNAGIDRFKEYNLGLSGNYTINKSEIIKKDKTLSPAERSGSNLVFNDLEIGDVIYLDYEYSFNKYGRFYNTFSAKFMLGSFHPKTNSSTKIVTPKDYKFNYRTVNGNSKPVITTKGNYKIYDWKFENQPFLPQAESYSPNDVDVAEYLHVSTFNSWTDISLWYSDLVRSKVEVDAIVEKTFKEIFPNGITSLSENQRAETIYNYIKNNFNYSYVSFRQSGYVPQKPSKTIKTKLGDCKDFSTLYITLAKMANLEANLVLINTNDYGYNNLVLPSRNFNHCIAKVKINGESQYLELTDKYLPYKSLPTSLINAIGLEIPRDRTTQLENNDLFHLKNVNRTLSEYNKKIILDLTEDKMKLNIDFNYVGHVNSKYASIFDEPNKEVIKKSVTDLVDNLLTEDFTLENLNNYERIDNDKKINYNVDVQLTSNIKKIGKTSIIQLPILLNAYTNSVVSIEDRAYDIDYTSYENNDIYNLEYVINIPEGKTFTEIPENLSTSYKAHKYSIDYKLAKPNQLIVKLNAKTNFINIKKEEYLAFKAFVLKIIEAETAYIGFK